MSDIKKRFGRRLKEVRLEKKLSQEELAEKINVHRTYVGMIERGERNLSLIKMSDLAKALKISISELTQGL